MIVSDPTEQVLGQELPALIKDGYTSFKVYTTYDLLKIDDYQFLDILALARREGAMVMVHDNVGYTPYEGRRVTGWPVSVINRGRVVVEAGELMVERESGTFLPRDAAQAARPLGRTQPELDPRTQLRRSSTRLNEGASMARYLKTAAAQLGPIHLADSRASVVRRLIAMLHEAHSAGCGLVVFPELALTTFFPRYWLETQSEIDAYFEREMPGPETRPLFEEAVRLGVGFYLGYAELVEEAGATRHYNTSILVDTDGTIIGKYRKVHLPGHAEHKPEAPFQHLEKRYFDVGNLGFPVWRGHGGIVGMCICNDRRWPETFRVMALQGAEMVVLGYKHADHQHLP